MRKAGDSRRAEYVLFAAVVGGLLAGGPLLFAKEPKQPGDALADYIARARQSQNAPAQTLGSLWNPSSFVSNMAADYKAHAVNDLITIRILEQTTAQALGSVKATRDFSASSGISGLLGTPGPTSGMQNIFSPRSSRALDGQAQTAATSALQTSLGGHVVDVLPNGVLVIQAEREIEMNNERQRVLVRGLVRPGDVLADNSVYSTSVSNLEVELRGKGVISDSVRPPNPLLRAILWIVGF